MSDSLIQEISFKQEVVDFISKDIAKYLEVETGGVLFGNVVNNRIVVKKAIDGGKKAIRERFLFKADKDYVDMNIDMIRANTDYFYLGEWHTHPQTNPEPSIIDLNSISEIAASLPKFALLTIIGFLDFRPPKFIDQSISLLKYNFEDYFYYLPTRIE